MKISRRGIEKIRAVVKWYESGQKDNPQTQASYPVPIGSIGVHVKIGGSAIGAATSATQMTSGSAELWKFDETGAGTATGVTVTVWNKETSGTISANAHCLALRVGHGYVILWELGACP